MDGYPQSIYKLRIQDFLDTKKEVVFYALSKFLGPKKFIRNLKNNSPI